MDILILNNISKRFGGLQALSGVSFAFRAERITALIGSNGAGKTTLLNMITGRIRPSGGTVEFNGKDITHASEIAIVAEGIGRMFQDLRLFPQLSCEENVIVALQTKAEEGVWAAMFKRRSLKLNRGSAAEKSDDILDSVGLYKCKNELASNLGYAQAKMLAFARVLALNPAVLLLDEPCSGLDKTALQTVREIIVKLRDSGRTIGLIEHNAQLVQELADDGVFLENGAVVATGDVRALFADTRVRERYLGLG